MIDREGSGFGGGHTGRRLLVAGVMCVWLAACQAAPADEAGASIPGADQPVGVDISLTLPSGDVERGAALAQSRDCLNCHRNLPVAPPFEDGDEPAIGVRAGERIKQTDYTGSATTVQGYLLESIVDPDAFVVDGYDPGLMPHDFGDRLTRQQAADLIVYLSSLQ